MESNKLTLDVVKHNFNIGDEVTVTKDRDSYDDFVMECVMSSFERKKLTVESIDIINEDLVHYCCVDENNVSPMLFDVKLAFIDADLTEYQSSVVLSSTELGIYIQQNSIDQLLGIQYFCVGNTIDNKFSGILYSQKGGGSYSEIFVFNDKELPSEDVNGNEIDVEIRESILNLLMNDNEFINGCWDKVFKYLDLDECSWEYKPRSKLGDNIVFNSGDIVPISHGSITFAKSVEKLSVQDLAEMLDIHNVLKKTLERLLEENKDEELESQTLITMTLESICEDEIYGAIVTRDEANAYLQKIAEAIKEKGFTFYDISIRGCEICSECSLVLLPDDECYESHNGKALCTSCSCRCEACDQYFTEEEVQESHNGYCCKTCNEVPIELTGLPQLVSLKSNFLTFVGEWINGKDCRTGENRVNGTVTYLRDGLYLYEFKTREDAFKYLFNDDRSVPYAMAEYDEEVSEENGEETFGEWEFNNGFQPEWLEAKISEFETFMLSLTNDQKSELIDEIHSWHDDCEAGSHGECEIFDAIQRNADDDEVLKIAFDIDYDLFEKVKNSQKTSLLDEGITVCFSGTKDDTSTPRYCIVQNTEEEGSSTLEDYDNLESAMEAYNYIKENGCHKSEENGGEIIHLESGTEITMDIEWWDIKNNLLVKEEGVDVPAITIAQHKELSDSFAWQVSDDDIALAFQEMGLPNGDTDIEWAREFLDCNAVEYEALKSDRLEKQSKNALEEIINQIKVASF